MKCERLLRGRDNPNTAQTWVGEDEGDEVVSMAVAAAALELFVEAGPLGGTTFAWSQIKTSLYVSITLPAKSWTPSRVKVTDVLVGNPSRAWSSNRYLIVFSLQITLMPSP